MKLLHRGEFLMTSLQNDAINLVKMMPEDKLYFLIEIMQGIAGIYNADTTLKTEKQKAFDELEKLRKRIPDLDEERELAEWREEKFEYEGVD